MSEMLCSNRPFKRPVGCDRGERSDDEAPVRCRFVRNGQAPGSPLAAAPRDNVQVEYARTPPSPLAPAEAALNLFEPREHIRWRQFAFYQRDGIGEVPSSPAVRRVEQDRSGVEQIELLVEERNRGFDDACRPSVPAVRPVGSNGDGVELRCAGHGPSPTAGQCSSPALLTDRRCRWRRPRATVRCVQGWSLSGTSAG